MKNVPNANKLNKVQKDKKKTCRKTTTESKTTEKKRKRNEKKRKKYLKRNKLQLSCISFCEKILWRKNYNIMFFVLNVFPLTIKNTKTPKTIKEI